MFGSKFTSPWFAWSNGRKPCRHRPVVLTLEDRCLPSTFQEFPLPAIDRVAPTDEFHRERITTGPDGNLWFTEVHRDSGAAVALANPFALDLAEVG